jgi:hypothetical protein
MVTGKRLKITFLRALIRGATHSTVVAPFRAAQYKKGAPRSLMEPKFFHVHQHPTISI